MRPSTVARHRPRQLTTSTSTTRRGYTTAAGYGHVAATGRHRPAQHVPYQLVGNCRSPHCGLLMPSAASSACHGTSTFRVPPRLQPPRQQRRRRGYRWYVDDAPHVCEGASADVVATSWLFQRCEEAGAAVLSTLRLSVSLLAVAISLLVCLQ